MRWIREIELSTTRKWTFTTTNDDGIRVWVDDRITIDAWYDHPAALFSATRWLAAGAHKVHVEYYDRMVSAMVVLPV